MENKDKKIIAGLSHDQRDVKPFMTTNNKSECCRKCEPQWMHDGHSHSDEWIMHQPTACENKSCPCHLGDSLRKQEEKQCDGCKAGLPLQGKGGYHTKNDRVVMVCQKERYTPKVATSEKKCDGSCYNLYICIYCHEEINVRIQPWDYFFPSQAFHKGCFKKCGNCSHGLCETCNKCHNVLENCPNSIYPSKNCFNSITKKPMDTQHESEDWEAEIEEKVGSHRFDDNTIEEIQDLKNLFSKVYQRCRVDEFKENNFDAGYTNGRNETIDFAVQEIKKMWNYPCDCARKQSECIHDYSLMWSIVGMLQGLDKAKSIISGVMKK